MPKLAVCISHEPHTHTHRAMHLVLFIVISIVWGTVSFASLCPVAVVVGCICVAQINKYVQNTQKCVFFIIFFVFVFVFGSSCVRVSWLTLRVCVFVFVCRDNNVILSETNNCGGGDGNESRRRKHFQCVF